MIMSFSGVSEEGAEGFLRAFGLNLGGIFLRGFEFSKLEVGAGVLGLTLANPRAVGLTALRGRTLIKVDAIAAAMDVAGAVGT